MHRAAGSPSRSRPQQEQKSNMGASGSKAFGVGALALARATDVMDGTAKRRFGYPFRSGEKGHAGAQTGGNLDMDMDIDGEDGNPWKRSFAAPNSLAHLSVSAYPPSTLPRGQALQQQQQSQQHIRQQSSKSNLSSYARSPTSADDSLDLPPHFSYSLRPAAG
ncbi:hypothetical protein EW145_g8700, partial [Phellinidium pouzarii]